MTTSKETDHLNYPALRALIAAAATMPLDDRTTLLKGLIPSIAQELDPPDFEAFLLELRLKGERMYEAMSHPGEGRATRQVMGERELEGR